MRRSCSARELLLAAPAEAQPRLASSGRSLSANNLASVWRLS